MKGKRVFITGATGLIGGQLSRRLLSEGAKVRVLVRSPGKGSWLKGLGAQLFMGDLENKELLNDAAQGCDYIYHAAGMVDETAPADLVWAVNVGGTENLVAAALAAQVGRFIHISSCAVYGSLQTFDIDETTPPRQTGKAYHDSKVASEEVVLKAFQEEGLPVVIARPSQVYGPRSEQFTVRPVKMIRSGKMILVDGGRFFFKPVYIDNLIDGLILCAQVEEAVGEAFNLTDGVPVPWRDYFGAYGKMVGINNFPSIPYSLALVVASIYEVRASLAGKKSSLTRGAVRALHSANSFSNQKARQILGWEPAVDLQQGLAQTQIWLQKEGYLPVEEGRPEQETL